MLGGHVQRLDVFHEGSGEEPQLPSFFQSLAIPKVVGLVAGPFALAPIKCPHINQLTYCLDSYLFRQPRFPPVAAVRRCAARAGGRTAAQRRPRSLFPPPRAPVGPCATCHSPSCWATTGPSGRRGTDSAAFCDRASVTATPVDVPAARRRSGSTGPPRHRVPRRTSRLHPVAGG